MTKIELICKSKELMKGCRNKLDFKKKYSYLYKKICSEGIIDDVFGDDYNDKYYQRKSEIYTLKKIEDICKSVTRTDFSNKYQFLKSLLKNHYHIDYKTLDFKKIKRITRPSKYSEKYIIEITKNMKYRIELFYLDKNVYKFCKNKGFFKTICKHLKSTNISRPQLIMTYILDTIFRQNGLVNDRKVLSPYEIDIFYENYKIGFEYNGKRWHENNNNDKIKIDNAIKLNLLIIVIDEKDRNFYERDIKEQICGKLDIINEYCKLDIKDTDVMNIKIDYDSIIYYNIEDYKAVIKKYSSIKEFIKNDFSIYNNLKCLGLLYKITTDIRRKTKLELLENSYKLCKKYENFNEFKNNHKYDYLRIYKSGDYNYINYYGNLLTIKNDDIISNNVSLIQIKNTNDRLYQHIKNYRKELLDIIPMYDDYNLKLILEKYTNFLIFKKKEVNILNNLSNIQLKLVFTYFKNLDYNKYFVLYIDINEIKNICLSFKTITEFKHKYPKLCKYLRKFNLIDICFEHIIIYCRNNRVSNKEEIIRTEY